MKDFTSRRGYNDLSSLPIVFLYRHSLELYLKAILAAGNKLAIALNRPDLYTDNIFDGHGHGHGLVGHLELLKKVFVAVGWNWDSSALGFDPGFLERAVKEFEEFDPQSHTFRYLIDKKRRPTVERHFMFSPVQFSQTLDPILSLFSGACMGLAVEFEELMEDMGNPERITMRRTTAQSSHAGDRAKKHQQTRKLSVSTQLP